MTNTDAKIMREAWKPIATAPERETVLICNEREGRPYTVAKAYRARMFWFYHGTIEEVEFQPSYWIPRMVKSNPFGIPLPGATS